MTSLTKVTVTGPPQLSEAVTRLVSGAGTNEAHCTVTGPGQVTDGGVVSLTVMVCVQLELLLDASVSV